MPLTHLLTSNKLLHSNFTKLSPKCPPEQFFSDVGPNSVTHIAFNCEISSVSNLKHFFSAALSLMTLSVLTGSGLLYRVSLSVNMCGGLFMVILD